MLHIIYTVLLIILSKKKNQLICSINYEGIYIMLFTTKITVLTNNTSKMCVFCEIKS